MSSSMSPPPQRPPPTGYSPPFQGNAASPTNPSSFGQPPAKRQRFSPDPRSPPNGQPMSYPTQARPQNGGPVTSAYGNPYAPQTAPMVQSPQNFAASPQNSFHTPQPYPFQQMPWQAQPSTPNTAQTPGPAAAGRQGSPPSYQSREMMPPPPRPNREEREEKVGVEEIGDSLYGSGINLKDEENYMHTVYNNRHTNDARSNQSFTSNTSTLSNSFNSLIQESLVGSQDRNGSFAGTMGRPRSQEEIEIDDRKKREAAATARAERMQHHLNNQFLQCNNVRKRMDRIARNHGVMLNLHGVSIKQSETKAAVNGAGTFGIVATDERVTGTKVEAQTDSSVAQGAPFENLMALVSLAAGERLRGLIDESHALARARRYGDHGRVVPPEFADIAEGEGKRSDEQIVPQNISGSQWDKTANGNGDDAGTQDSANRQGERSSTAESQATVSFQGNLSASLRSIAQRDRQAEKDRVKKREARKRTAADGTNGNTNGDYTTNPGTPAEGGAASAAGGADGAAATNGNVPAEVAAPVKVSKKEQAKQQKEKSSMEAQSHNTVNRTAMMAMGRKGKKFSWMTGGAASLPTNRYAKPGTSGSVTPAGGAGAKSEARSPAAAGGAGGAGVPAELQWGDWREDGVGGKGVQLRDLIFVLERDGREKMALEKAMGKMI